MVVTGEVPGSFTGNPGTPWSRVERAGTPTPHGMLSFSNLGQAFWPETNNVTTSCSNVLIFYYQ